MASALSLVDYFLKIDGLEGDSSDVEHKNEFEITGFSFGVENPTTIGSATGGAGAGKIKFNEFTIKKTTDKASPLFFKNCCAGAHYKSVALTVRKAGGDPQTAGRDLLHLKLSDVLTTSYLQTAGDVLPQDSISLNFQKFDVSTQASNVTVPALQGGILSFDAKTNTLQVMDAPGGVFTVGATGDMVTRAALEYDISSLIGLLRAPFSNTSLHLSIDQVQQPEGPPISPPVDVANPSKAQGPKPPRFDVILYAPADGVLTLEDLTRGGHPIGQLTLDPGGKPAMLEVDINEFIWFRTISTFGIRLQGHGLPIPGLMEEEGIRGEGPEEGPAPHLFSASFTIDLSLVTH